MHGSYKVRKKALLSRSSILKAGEIALLGVSLLLLLLTYYIHATLVLLLKMKIPLLLPANDVTNFRTQRI